MNKRVRKMALLLCVAFCLVEIFQLGTPINGAAKELEMEEAPVYLAGSTADVRQVILEGLENLQKTIDVRGYHLREEDFPKCWDDIFYGEGTAFASGLSRTYFMEAGYIAEIYPEYAPEYTKQDVQDYKDKREKVLTTVIQPGMSDLEKTLALHDYIVSHVSYDLSGQKRANAHDALVRQTAVYDGYVICYLDLLRHAGVEARRIYSSGMAHAWVAVRIDGSWYHVDCVKDDPTRAENEAKAKMSGPESNHPAEGWPGRVDHKYFLLSDTKLKETHSGWYSDIKCSRDRFDYTTSAEVFWNDRNEPIISQFVYVGSDCYTIKAVNYQIGLYKNQTDLVCKIDYPQCDDYYYSFLSYDNGYLIYNDLTKVYALKPGETTPTVVYTYTGAGHISGCLAEDGKAKLLILSSFRNNQSKYNYLTSDKTIEVTLSFEDSKPTPKPTATPTPKPGTTGSVKSFGNATDAVKVEMIAAKNITAADGSTILAGTVVKTENLTGDQQYSLASLPNGTYTLRVSKKGHVARDYTVTVGKTTAAPNIELYLEGDVDKSGGVDIGDHQRLFTYLQGTNPITNEYDLKIADVDGSGTIDIGDHQRLFTHLQGTNPLY